ncbi:unnamed protein product [Phyllotreta striolata]|uniref:Uncharacterized protein n=1 Tax=Phyllotreta striolata TaxID=444603 RepID=A0A9N9TKG7_PHYSR|nr:unnamed protein product [Phyllotreta striolata]
MSGEYFGSENDAKFYNDYVMSPKNNEKYGQDHRFADDNRSITSSTESANMNKSLKKHQRELVLANPNDPNKTVNNLLNGITNTVNRISDLHVQLSNSARNRASHTNRYYNDSLSNPSMICEQIPFTDQASKLPDQPNMHVCASSTITKTRNFKKKMKDSKQMKTQSSLMTLKRNIKVDKKVSKPLLEHQSSRPGVSSKANKQAKLVEIFHNKEAKSSDSEEGYNKKNHYVTCDGDHLTCATPEVPLLNLDNCKEIIDGNADNKQLVHRMITGDYYDQPLAPRLNMNYSQKSYQLPTIASRMKQNVVNTLMGSSNLTIGGTSVVRSKKAIPFCPAITASPSHNIGINIQQVMNIMRNRQPINGISPTLAHNIGLAADRLNNRPMSGLVTDIQSKTYNFMKSQHCPLSNSNLNYQQLQDLAKGIPEETQEEMDGEEPPDFKTLVITGPTGEITVKTKNVTSWANDTAKTVECTCLPETGNDINYIANNIKKAAIGKVASSQINLSQRKPDTSVNKFNFNTPNNPKLLKRPHTTKTKLKDTPKLVTHLDQLAVCTPQLLKGKEKNLKEVLTQLHDEFEQLNTRYEELSKTTSSTNQEACKPAMEHLEVELNKKEEEIMMVMTLCKEIMALKNQIKSLKKAPSHSSVAPDAKGTPTSATFTDYCNPQAAFHLTKLLKQIKTYQMRYKNDEAV